MNHVGAVIVKFHGSFPPSRSILGDIYQRGCVYSMVRTIDDSPRVHGGRLAWLQVTLQTKFVVVHCSKVSAVLDENLVSRHNWGHIRWLRSASAPQKGAVTPAKSRKRSLRSVTVANATRRVVVRYQRLESCCLRKQKIGPGFGLIILERRQLPQAVARRPPIRKCNVMGMGCMGFVFILGGRQ